MKRIGPYVLWLLFGLVFGGTLIYALGRWSDRAFLDGMMGNCFATTVGVLLGLPIALEINRWQQSVSDANAQEKQQQEEETRTAKVLRLVRNELQSNLNRLRSTQPEQSGQDKRVVLVERLKDELWRAFSDGGELQWVRDLELLDTISTAYHGIRGMIYLQDKHFEAHHLSAIRFGDKTSTDIILEYMVSSDPFIMTQIAVALQAIDKKLQQLGPPESATSSRKQ